MYQNNFLRHNFEKKDNVFDKKFSLHDKTHGLIQKYMFIFLLNDFCSNILC